MRSPFFAAGMPRRGSDPNLSFLLFAILLYAGYVWFPHPQTILPVLFYPIAQYYLHRLGKYDPFFFKVYRRYLQYARYYGPLSKITARFPPPDRRWV